MTYLQDKKSEMLWLFYDILIPDKNLFTHENKTPGKLTLAQLTYF